MTSSVKSITPAAFVTSAWARPTAPSEPPSWTESLLSLDEELSELEDPSGSALTAYLLAGRSAPFEASEVPDTSRGGAARSGMAAIGPGPLASAAPARFFFPAPGFGRSESRTDGAYAQLSRQSRTTVARFECSSAV